MTLLDELSLHIRAYHHETGVKPTHIFIPGNKYDVPSALTTLQGVRVVEMLDPNVKTILVGVLQSYAHIATR